MLSALDAFEKTSVSPLTGGINALRSEIQRQEIEVAILTRLESLHDDQTKAQVLSSYFLDLLDAILESEKLARKN